VRKINKGKEKRVNLNIPLQLHNSFKSTTAAQGKNMTDVLMQFIMDYVEKNSPAHKGSKGRQ
jgi:hypothetical protein